MFKKLKQRWNVNALNFSLIFCTFAIGGSLSGIVAKKILSALNLEKGFAWILPYILTLTLIWPISVLIISIPFGQFSFFKKYISTIFKKLSGIKNKLR